MLLAGDRHTQRSTQMLQPISKMNSDIPASLPDADSYHPPCVSEY